MINIRQIILWDQEPGQIVKVLQNWGALTSSDESQINNFAKCAKCGQPMTLTATQDLKTWVDGFYWQCKNEIGVNMGFGKCRKKLSIRFATFFAKSNLRLAQIIIFVRLWVSHCEIQVAAQEAGISGKAAAHWNSKCGTVVIFACEEQSVEIGGPGKTVEIDESKFGKRKHHKGRDVEGQWIFGGIERESGQFFLVAVPDRKKRTLIPIIKKFVRPGTTIMSDLYGTYTDLDKEGYSHKTVNHSKHFVDPTSRAHTNTIESMWRHAKYRLPQYRRCKKFYAEYLARYMFITRCNKSGVDPTVAFFQAAGRMRND